jgi:hypothetical protein
VIGILRSGLSLTNGSTCGPGTTFAKEEQIQNDNLLNAAFRKADKDLRKMLDKAAAGSPPP